MKTALYFWAYDQRNDGEFFTELNKLLGDDDQFLMPISSSEILAPVGSIFEFFHDFKKTERDDGDRAVAFRVIKHIFRPQENLLMLRVHSVGEDSDAECFHLAGDMTAPELAKYLQGNWMNREQTIEWANNP